jgi:phage terminase large subunit-like protein
MSAPTEWTTACPDWEERLLGRKPLIAVPPLFPDEARSARQVLEKLCLADVAGSPMLGAVSNGWVLEFCDAIFGSYDPDSGRRLIREFFLLIAKKNGKSTTAAAIMLAALVRNWRQEAEFTIVAPTKEVADNSYRPAASMVAHSEALSDLMHVQNHFRTITHRHTGAQLRVVAADSQSLGGKKSTGVLVDEMWLFGKRADAEDMLREATGGLASRPEGFVIYLSTQSDEPPAGVFRQRLQYARGVRDGRIADKRFLPVIYEFPQAILDADGHREKANFYIPNPNLGSSVDVEFLEREFDKALETGDESLRGFYAKHLNLEIGLALRSDRWAGAEYWERCSEPSLTLDALLARSEVVCIGIDGGGLDDLLGLAVLGRDRKTRQWLLWTHAWAYSGVLERRKGEAARLRDLAKAGDLTIVERLGDDVDAVAQIAAQIDETGLLHKVGLDPVGVGSVIDALAERGITGDRVVGVPQGWRLSGAIKTAERKLADRSLSHGGQALMAWAVGNAKVEPRGNALTITKQQSGSAKIDPLMAALDAVALMSTNPVIEGGSFGGYLASLTAAGNA